MGGGGVESMSLKSNQAEFVFTGGCPLRCWEIGGRRAHENLEGEYMCFLNFVLVTAST